MSQTLSADAALYLAVTSIIEGDATLLARLPGGIQWGKIPSDAPLPALAWTIKEAQKERTLTGITSLLVPFWFKVLTATDTQNPKPFGGEAATARLRYLFDGTPRSERPRIYGALNALLEPRGWRLQSCCEETPFPPSNEPVGDDFSSFRTAQGGIYHARLQPFPS